MLEHMFQIKILKLHDFLNSITYIVFISQRENLELLWIILFNLGVSLIEIWFMGTPKHHNC